MELSPGITQGHGFPGGPDSKESAYNVRYLGLILGWEDPLEKNMVPHSNILAWRIPMDRGAWRVTVHGGHKELDTTEQLSTAQYIRQGLPW